MYMYLHQPISLLNTYIQDVSNMMDTVHCCVSFRFNIVPYPGLICITLLSSENFPAWYPYEECDSTNLIVLKSSHKTRKYEM